MASADDEAVEDMIVIATCSLISDDIYMRMLELADVLRKEKTH